MIAYDAGMTKTTETHTTGCSGRRYAINPDDAAEGYDIRHTAPCPAHPDADYLADYLAKYRAAQRRWDAFYSNPSNGYC